MGKWSLRHRRRRRRAPQGPPHARHRPPCPCTKQGHIPHQIRAPFLQRFPMLIRRVHMRKSRCTAPQHAPSPPQPSLPPVSSPPPPPFPFPPSSPTAAAVAACTAVARPSPRSRGFFPPPSSPAPPPPSPPSPPSLAATFAPAGSGGETTHSPAALVGLLVGPASAAAGPGVKGAAPPGDPSHPSRFVSVASVGPRVAGPGRVRMGSGPDVPPRMRPGSGVSGWVVLSPTRNGPNGPGPGPARPALS